MRKVIRKKRRRQRKFYQLVFAGIFGALLLALAGVLIFSDSQKNQNASTILSKLASYQQKDGFLSDDLTSKSLSALTDEVKAKKSDLYASDVTKITEKITALKMDLDLQTQVNALFEKPVLTQKGVSQEAIKNDLTQAAVVAIKLSALTEKNKWATGVTSSISDAKSQLTEIASLRTSISTVQATPTQSAIDQLKVEVAKIKNAALAKSLTDQLTTLEDSLALKQKYADKKYIALTFDDGPNGATTPSILKTLKAEGVQGTFFVLGQQAQSYPNIVKQAAADGNEVSSHTWDHKDLTTLTAAQQKQEITSAQNLIEKLTGKHVPFFRPPYGNFNAATKSATNNALIYWGIDTNDWRYSTAAPVVQNALTAAHSGAILLMHDIHPVDVDALPQIIEGLKKQGYSFVTVSQLIEIQNGSITPGHVYYGN
ncbi:MAG: polysaccharide deacetylase family protein [Streptococcaceae bacterium]|nr:polysaccharide deacetylase family protein [Streptococcaceae bacterium]